MGGRWAGGSWGFGDGGGEWADGGGIGADEAKGAGEMPGSRRLAGKGTKQKADGALLAAWVTLVRRRYLRAKIIYFQLYCREAPSRSRLALGAITLALVSCITI